MEHVYEECTCTGKKCTKCKQVRCIGRYSNDKRLKSGLQSQCKVCDHAANKAWREANREYDKARHQAWNEAHSERVKERARQYREANRERLADSRKRHYANNVDRLRANALQYYYDNHDKQLERKRQRREKEGVREQERAAWREYYQQNKEFLNARVRRYQQAFPERHAVTQAVRRTRKRLAGGSYTAQEWLELKVRYNYTCLCCRCKEPEIQLHADHVIPLKKGGSSFIDNIQPLCKSCNSSKGTKIIDFRKDVS